MSPVDVLDTHDVLRTPAPTLSLKEAEEIARGMFGISGKLDPLFSERDQNFRVRSDHNKIVVLKIANSSENIAVLDFQIAGLRHIYAQNPTLPVPRVVQSLDGEDKSIIKHDGREHVVRVLTYLDGKSLTNCQSSPALRKNIGELLARLGIALRGFFHPAAGHELLWDLKRAAQLRDLLVHITNPDKRSLATRVQDNFDEIILPILRSSRAQVIHNDLNPDNTLVNSSNGNQMSGVIDFGDMVHSALINDLAVAAAYQLEIDDNPIESVCELVSAYHKVSPLFEEELLVLPDLIRTRALMTVTISAWRSKSHPENFAYITSHDNFAWKNLQWFEQLNNSKFSDALLHACNIGRKFNAGQNVIEKSDMSNNELIKNRTRYLGESLSLTYEKPLHMVRGNGVWLYDTQGEAYLDAYNNVPHVGHCHPYVTGAIMKQAATLNTNTRYLHTNIVELAQRLGATLPGELSVCMFVCTGSEANDLALQIAKTISGAQGAIVTEFSYHGNSIATRQLSTEDVPLDEREDWVATVPAADVYAGLYREDAENPGELYAAHVVTALDTLNKNGHALAACIFDSVHSSDGILIQPEGYLPAVYERVRAAGGLCIADEVQSGFGRMGTHMWGFQQHDVIPDIVTLGKPMGNGHPIGAVITTPEIAKTFSRHQSYFNTYGGNPVACAAALAVLDVIENEALQNNALQLGKNLLNRLLPLKQRYSFIGDIRGSGLFIGIEIVDNPETRTPDAPMASSIFNALRENNILVGLTGSKNNVLKIRPPMVFSQSNADLLIETLENVLIEFANKAN